VKVKVIPLGQDAQIVFWDNGSGIKSNLLENVCQMFFRGSDKSKGHGLGLYLAKKAVEKMNGVLDVKSEEGVYTQVRISLPSVVV
jgi:signal transduction histidine kinase